jgi:hypothetical protein
MLQDLHNYVAYHHFKFFENVQFEIYISQHRIPGKPVIKNAKTCIAQSW